MKRTFVAIAFCVVVSGNVLVAQQAKPSPAVPAQSSTVSPTADAPVTDVNAYPFTKALERLKQDQGSAPAVPSVSAAKAGSEQVAVLHRSPSSANSYMPPQIKAAALPLSGSALKALAIADEAKKSDAVPEPGKDGRVTYTFGAGLPTIVCSPLHVSILELQPGETITGEPAIGDSVRWELLPGMSGDGKNAEPVIIIKPHETGLDTNLVVTTNKRIYYLRLVSEDLSYIARVAFSYQEDEDAHWKAFVAEQQRVQTERENSQVVATVNAGADFEKLYFDYEIKGKNPSLTPVRVMDDGNKTIITMPENTKHLELPSLVVMNPKLKGEKGEEIVNYRVKDNVYIVDRLFDHAALLIGNGKTAEKVTIKRKTPLTALGGK